MSDGLALDSRDASLLDVQHLTVRFGETTAVDDVSFRIAPGETLGLVGESGSGKSVTAFSILRLVQPPGRIVSGRIMSDGRDLLTLSEREMREVRGARISLIFQEPMTALNPVMRVGDQIAEALTVHGLATRAEARTRAVELLDAVRIPDASKRARDYPHQLSGGMRQRVMIAIALACRPPLVIADEPTTALDVTIQAQVLDLLRELKARLNLALLLITHDFGIVAEMADRVAVMYRGRIVEEGPVRQILRAPVHEYTKALLAAVPGMGGPEGPPLRSRMTSGQSAAESDAAIPERPRLGADVPTQEPAATEPATTSTGGTASSDPDDLGRGRPSGPRGTR